MATPARCYCASARSGGGTWVRPMLRVPVGQEVRALSPSQTKEHLEVVEQTPRVDWANLMLPETWPDQLDFRNPLSIAHVLAHVFRKRQ